MTLISRRNALLGGATFAMASLPVMSEAVPENMVRSIANTLVHEGGATYTNHPNDPGGPTKYGITIWDVRKYLKKNATAADVRALTQDQAIEIYREHYWKAIDADSIEIGLDYTTFDYTVNAGLGRSWRTYMQARRETDDPIELIKKVNDRRLAFQLGLGGKYRVFHRGWKNRILSVRALSLQMAGVPARHAGLDFLIPRIGPGRAYNIQEELDVQP